MLKIEFTPPDPDLFPELGPQTEAEKKLSKWRYQFHIGHRIEAMMEAEKTSKILTAFMAYYQARGDLLKAKAAKDLAERSFLEAAGWTDSCDNPLDCFVWIKDVEGFRYAVNQETAVRVTVTELEEAGLIDYDEIENLESGSDRGEDE